MARILIFLLILLGAVILFAQFLRRTGMFFPDRYPVGRWDFANAEDHFFTAPDGVRLHGWWFRAANRNAPLLVWCHGNAGNITDRADAASELAKRGVSVFVFDYRGFGRSEGRASESGLYRDSLAAFDYVRDQGAARIVMYGESIGGPYAAYVAKERKGPVRAVILENTFPSLADLGNALYRPLPLGWTAPLAMRTTDWLNNAGVAVLVLHGTRDAVIPYALGKKLYDGLTVPKELVTAQAGHCEIPLLEAARYYEPVTRFASR
jgi:fermentation-respiration switch protein FrsA (DUF1100 family)